MDVELRAVPFTAVGGPLGTVVEIKIGGKRVGNIVRWKERERREGD